jgi:hypothetical protein
VTATRTGTYGSDSINFSIGSGTQAISPTSALPTITDVTTIDGTSQPGYAGTPIIELAGAGAGASVSGLTITAGNCVVSGLVINQVTALGIVITGSSATGNAIEGNYIGTDTGGAAARANANGGILISTGAHDNTIGGLTSTPGAGAGNVISGNTGNGISLTATAGVNNVIQGNIIGLNAAGTTMLGNSVDGIKINAVTVGAGTLIGGVISQARNVISGQIVNIDLSTSGSNASVTIQGNYIGTDITGTLDRSPGTGIVVGSSPGTVVGGMAPGAGNLIAGNSSGITIDVLSHPVIGGLYNCVVQGNTIGLSATGTALPNGTGINITNADNLIGGTTAGASNVISGNSGVGIVISGTSATGNTVAGNLIGTNAAGTAALGNSGDGVQITGSASNNTIGGTTVATRNVISGNTGNGVLITGSGNVIAGNYIGTNAAGTAALGNAGCGLFLGGAAGSTRIGTNGDGVADATEGNVISGNILAYVAIFGSGSGAALITPSSPAITSAPTPPARRPSAALQALGFTSPAANSREWERMPTASPMQRSETLFPAVPTACTSTVAAPYSLLWPETTSVPTSPERSEWPAVVPA